MGCLFVLFAAMFPRAADILLWIVRPNLFLAPFNGNWLWPLLGIVFLPFTTLFYVLLWSPEIGLSGVGWFIIVAAVFMDVSHLAGSGFANRGRIPGLST